MAEHVRRAAAADPAAAADAAWAAGDTIHAAAHWLRDPALRIVADTYDRAARAPDGQVRAGHATATGCGRRRGSLQSPGMRVAASGPAR